VCSFEYQILHNKPVKQHGSGDGCVKVQYPGRFEYAQARKLRARNKHHYRLAHWPLWIAVFFLAPGTFTFALFDHGFDWANAIWLLVVIFSTGVAGWYGFLPGTERTPYILRFDEDRPNPLYRRICYTFAWNAVLSFATLNLCGLLIAALTGQGYLQKIYRYGHPPLCATILLLGMVGLLPRAGLSTKAEGVERRYFYGSVWAVTLAQILLLAAWKVDLPSSTANPVKLLVFVGALLFGATASYCGVLPRTRPIVAGELMSGT
jgi:hypothetical protein